MLVKEILVNMLERGMTMEPASPADVPVYEYCPSCVELMLYTGDMVVDPFTSKDTTISTEFKLLVAQ